MCRKTEGENVVVVSMIPLPANESGNEMATFYDDAETCATPVDVTRQPSDAYLYSEHETSSTTVAVATDSDCTVIGSNDSKPFKCNETTDGTEVEPVHETLEDN